MKELEQRFRAHWAKKGFGSGGRPVLLALSGGIDSMVLAHLLLGAKIPFAAAHCNFSLRGGASEGDAAFVQDWCERHNILCFQQVFKTSEEAARSGDSIQVTARRLRYRWFEELRAAHAFSAILTAHHSDDVAETMLINLCRGTGIAGLHGIPERNGHIIRPMLFASRVEIAAYAAEVAIAWREDASNQKTDYLRNGLRHEVLPKLEALLPGAARRIAETAGRVAEAEDIYRQAIKRRLSRLLEKRGADWYVPVRLLGKTENLTAISYELFTPFNFSPDQLPHILRLLDSDSGRVLSSPTHRIIRHRDFLVITAVSDREADLILIDEIPAVVSTLEGEFTFSWTTGSAAVTEEMNTACLDASRIEPPLVLRTRREGDYFYPLGMGGKKKKLKRFLIDIKMPLHEKEKLRILESDQRILWVVGKRIDERFKVGPSTERVLKVVFQPA